MNTPLTESDRPRGADFLTIGFAAAVACWLIGYLTHMVGSDAAGPVTAVGLGLALLIGGFVAGRTTDRPLLKGTLAGLTTGLINLMILGSVLKPDAAAGAALGASVVVTAVVVGLAALVGARFRVDRPDFRGRNWPGRFALVGVAATGVLLLSGGLVTGREAGLAVSDWPTSFGHNMWLYPLSKMTGNIYYEHTHRLYGTLVGLTTLVLAGYLCLFDPRKWVKALAVLALLAVIGQGIMGGLRVTEATGGTSAYEVATLDKETGSSAFLRVAHGTFAQIFFALMTTLAVVTSTAWKRSDRTPHAAAGTDRAMSIALLVLLVIQLVLGARVRHLDETVFIHLTNALLVLFVAFGVGMRAWGIHGESHPALRRLGIAVVAIVGLQLALGFVALGAKSMAAAAEVPTLFDVIATTAHQFTGAVLLAVATAVCLLIHRLLIPSRAAATESPDASAANPGPSPTAHP